MYLETVRKLYSYAPLSLAVHEEGRRELRDEERKWREASEVNQELEGKTGRV